MNSVVVITSHCPLFVDRVHISSNIIIDNKKAKVAKSISEIRDLLGVRASDNLINASLVLVVEGRSDKCALGSIFEVSSNLIKSAMKSGSFVIDPAEGATNLNYRLSLHQNSLCNTHIFLDNDENGRLALDSARKCGLIKESEYHLAVCRGMGNSEFEDCVDSKLYSEAILNEYGVDINVKDFKNNTDKWSMRMRRTFLNQGKQWNDDAKRKVKEILSNLVLENPDNCFIQEKRTFLDSLIKTLERRINDQSNN